MNENLRHNPHYMKGYEDGYNESEGRFRRNSFLTGFGVALVIVIIVMSCAGCQSTGHEVEIEGRLTPINIEEITIEECQYLFYDGNSRSAFAHKGNCTNPIHQCK